MFVVLLVSDLLRIVLLFDKQEVVRINASSRVFMEFKIHDVDCFLIGKQTVPD